MNTTFWIFFFFCLFIKDGHAASLRERPLDWSYENQDAWPAQDCKLSEQSPIDIITENVTKKNLGELVFDPRFGESFQMSISNEDKSIALSFVDKSMELVVSGGSLMGEYVFLKMTFYWRSQHKIDGIDYPLETHMVFYGKKYNDPKSAVTHPDGFLALVVFYTISGSENPNFDNIVESVPKIADIQNQEVTLEKEVSLGSFLPESTNAYYQYHGSVIKPYCEEIVVFVVFPEPLTVGEDQLEKLKQIKDENHELVLRNNRDVQPLNSRPVYFNEG